MNETTFWSVLKTICDKSQQEYGQTSVTRTHDESIQAWVRILAMRNPCSVSYSHTSHLLLPQHKLRTIKQTENLVRCSES